MPRNSLKPKKKLKTHRGAHKRFKITANGKILRMHSGKRHLLGTKAAKRMRKLKKLAQVHKTDVAAVRQMLPTGPSDFCSGQSFESATASKIAKRTLRNNVPGSATRVPAGR